MRRGASCISITPNDGKTYRAKIKDYDSEKDIALLKIDTERRAFLTISGTLPRQGETVIAIGNP